MGIIRGFIEELSKEQPGPAPSFTSPQILKMILVIGGDEPVGRKRLSTVLGLGEGVVRSMLRRLTKAGIVKIDARGCMLTDRGRAIYSELVSAIRDVGWVKTAMPWTYQYNYAVVVKGRAHLVKRGLEQRDAAIRAGADAAIIMVYSEGKLKMPNVSVISDERPEFASKILGEIRPEEGDVIIIAGADKPTSAIYGSLAAAETII